jgi:hypothetical protein
LPEIHNIMHLLVGLIRIMFFPLVLREMHVELTMMNFVSAIPVSIGQMKQVKILFPIRDFSDRTFLDFLLRR